MQWFIDLVSRLELSFPDNDRRGPNTALVQPALLSSPRSDRSELSYAAVVTGENNQRVFGFKSAGLELTHYPPDRVIHALDHHSIDASFLVFDLAVSFDLLFGCLDR